MSKYPWFRLYSNDLLNDRKLTRIARVCQVPICTVRGFWLTLLAMANDSPDRGCLLIAEDIPVTEDEIRFDCGLDEQTFEALMSEMDTLGMIEREPCIIVSKFLDRNPPSDSSTERVRRHRQKKTVTGTEQGNVTETLRERPSNVIESESESYSESESEAVPAPADNGRHPAFTTYEQLSGQIITAKIQMDDILEYVPRDDASISRWGEVVRAWIGMGWKPRNITGMLDHFREGRIPGRDYASARSPPVPVPKQEPVIVSSETFNATPGVE
jgi:hypothetical protein